MRRTASSDDPPAAPIPTGRASATCLRGGAEFAAASADESLAAEIGRDVLQAAATPPTPQSPCTLPWRSPCRRRQDWARPAPASSMTPRRGRAKSFVFAPQAAPGAINGQSFMVPVGPRAVTLMHIRHGKLQWAQLLAPAERMARNGFPVPRALSRDLQAGAARSAPTARRAASTARERGTAITEGDIWAPTDLAATHRRAAPARRPGFLRGQLRAR